MTKFKHDVCMETKHTCHDINIQCFSMLNFHMCDIIILFNLKIPFKKEMYMYVQKIVGKSKSINNYLQMQIYINIKNHIDSYQNISVYPKYISLSLRIHNHSVRCAQSLSTARLVAHTRGPLPYGRRALAAPDECHHIAAQGRQLQQHG